MQSAAITEAMKTITDHVHAFTMHNECKYPQETGGLQIIIDDFTCE